MFYCCWRHKFSIKQYCATLSTLCGWQVIFKSTIYRDRFVALPVQKCLRERAIILRYTCNDYLVLQSTLYLRESVRSRIIKVHVHISVPVIPFVYITTATWNKCGYLTFAVDHLIRITVLCDTSGSSRQNYIIVQKGTKFHISAERLVILSRVRGFPCHFK